MAVYVNNITINTGEYFSRDYYLDNADGTPLDLTGYTASSHVRKHPDSLKPAGIFNVGFINRADGHIRVSLASTATTAIKPGRYVYDVMFIDSSNQKSIVIEGNVLATQDITPSCIVTVYTNDEVGIINESGSGGISLSNINDYGVVHIGVNFNECSKFIAGSSTTRDMLEDAAQRQQLIDYMRMGGVVWLNVEWWNGSANGDGCSNRDNINAMLTLLGTEIRTNSDSTTQGSTRSTETSVINSNFPATQSQDASVVFTGGTPVFVDGTDIITTYEKIGNGILYVSGDSNTFSGPSYPENYYNALRSLVLNS